eukprot:scaffold462943_cov79-Attheya_sp.AAC.1
MTTTTKPTRAPPPLAPPIPWFPPLLPTMIAKTITRMYYPHPHPDSFRRRHSYYPCTVRAKDVSFGQTPTTSRKDK